MSIRKTSAEFKSEVFTKYGNEYSVLSEYQTAHTKIRVKHNSGRCNCNEFLITPNNFVTKGHKCPACFGTPKKELSQFIKQLNEIYNNEYVVIGQYVTNKTPIKIIHKKCEQVLLLRPNDMLMGHACPYCSRQRGSNHHHFNSNLTDKERLQKRDVNKNYIWRIAVYKRDNYRCVCCNAYGDMNAHHLDGYNWCKEKRFDLDNGATLCLDCHKRFHQIYGHGNNTKTQFNDFLKWVRTEMLLKKHLRGDE